MKPVQRVIRALPDNAGSILTVHKKDGKRIGKQTVKFKNDHRSPRNTKPCMCVQLPATDYLEAHELQRHIVAARIAGKMDDDVVLMLEHFPVFTLGRRGGRENLMVSEKFLEKSNIQVLHVERGGDITFHGPGQLVVYPIIKLSADGLKVIDYVAGLEEVMVRTAADWGIRAAGHPKNRGVWIEEKKLGSIGIAIRRGISFHGLALNVNLSLEPFSWINPCGFRNIAMTSMANEAPASISMEMVREHVKHHLAQVFGFQLMPINLTRLLGSIKTAA